MQLLRQWIVLHLVHKLINPRIHELVTSPQRPLCEAFKREMHQRCIIRPGLENLGHDHKAMHLDEHLLDVHVVRHGDACEQQLNHPAIGGGISHGRHHTRTFWLSNRMQYGMKVFIQDLGPLLLLMPPTGQ